jgi:hypothetical protein
LEPTQATEEQILLKKKLAASLALTAPLASITGPPNKALTPVVAEGYCRYTAKAGP